ncbi:MAG: ThuA domain-containing protein [Granulosicoccus sp.]
MQNAIALLISSLLFSGCSGSNSNDSQLPVETEVISADGMNVSVDEDAADSAVELDDGSQEGTTNETAGETASETSSGNDIETAIGVPDPVVPDPLVQNLIVVVFDITVPVYVSDALQVRVVWGDRDIMAEWIGDESWSARGDFPTNTEHQLVVTFYDDNGDITLGSFEQRFKTESNDLEVYRITADQFDTDQWDSDSDGVSNINELIAGTDASESPRVLLFSETRNFRHNSIENALGALEELATSAAVQTDRASDSAGVFTDANLANYDAVVWVMTSGDVLNADEQVVFEHYIRSGGGYAGVHSASDTEYEWPWYGGLVGAYFDRHPAVQSASQDVEDGSHPSTAHLSSRWRRTDEWYDYRTNPRAQVNVLLSLDEDSYTEGGMGDDHPSAWYHDYDGGRSWYTGGGHTKASFSEPDFRAHLLGGLLYAAGLGGMPTDP